MAKLYNLARMTVSGAPSTGTITLGSAASGFLTFAQAGVVDGETVAYGIADGANSEVGTGVYTASGTTLTRTVTKSTNSDAAINATSAAQVYVTARKEEILNKTGADTMTGILTLGPDTSDGNATLNLNKAASGDIGAIQSRKAGLLRWQFELGTNTAEDPAQLTSEGSNFSLYRYLDDGTTATRVIFVTRSSGEMELANTVNITPSTGRLNRLGSAGSGGLSIQGTDYDDDAAAGYIGEYKSSSVATGSAVSVTSGAYANMTSLTGSGAGGALTPGDWDVSLMAHFNMGATTIVRRLVACINTTGGGALNAAAGAWNQHIWEDSTVGIVMGANATMIPVGPWRVKVAVSTTQTVYAVCSGTFSGGGATVNAWGLLSARRVR